MVYSERNNVERKIIFPAASLISVINLNGRSPNLSPLLLASSFPTKKNTIDSGFTNKESFNYSLTFKKKNRIRPFACGEIIATYFFRAVASELSKNSVKLIFPGGK